MDISKETKELNKQLFPTGRAWAYVHGSEQVETEITEFVDGLGQPFVDGIGNHFVSVFGSEASPSKRLVNAFLKSFERFYTDLYSILNTILPDNDDFSETDASNWERVYSLLNNVNLTLPERKETILRKITYPNGIAERANSGFIQDQLQAAGFNVSVIENRFDDGASGWEVFDPALLAPNLEQFGLSEFGIGEFNGEIAGVDYTICANYIDETLDATYFDNPSSPLTRDEILRYTLIIGGSSVPSVVEVKEIRKNEFRELILKLKPAHSVAFLYIEYV